MPARGFTAEFTEVAKQTSATAKDWDITSCTCGYETIDWTAPDKTGANRENRGFSGRQKRGWQTVECTLYGETVTKTHKTFLATYRPAGGIIRVVLIKEDHGWFAIFCTDPDARAPKIIQLAKRLMALAA